MKIMQQKMRENNISYLLRNNMNIMSNFWDTLDRHVTQISSTLKLFTKL